MKMVLGISSRRGARKGTIKHRGSDMRITLLIELMMILIVGSLSIIEGIRLTLHKGLQLYDIVGPGLYNVGIGILLLLLGLIYLLFRPRRSDEEKKKTEEREYRLNMINMVCILAGYILLIDFIGYLLSTMIFFVLIHRIVGFKSWRVNVIVSMGVTLSFYIIFVRLLDMIFPTGILLNF
jgi:putative tricarboxylic transport membrane protein